MFAHSLEQNRFLAKNVDLRLVIDGLDKINIILVGEMEGGNDPTVRPIMIEYIKLEAALKSKSKVKHLHSQNRKIKNTFAWKTGSFKAELEERLKSLEKVRLHVENYLSEYFCWAGMNWLVYFSMSWVKEDEVGGPLRSLWVCLLRRKEGEVLEGFDFLYIE